MILPPLVFPDTALCLFLQEAKEGSSEKVNKIKIQKKKKIEVSSKYVKLLIIIKLLQQLFSVNNDKF